MRQRGECMKLKQLVLERICLGLTFWKLLRQQNVSVVVNMQLVRRKFFLQITYMLTNSKLPYLRQSEMVAKKPII